MASRIGVVLMSTVFQRSIATGPVTAGAERGLQGVGCVGLIVLFRGFHNGFRCQIHGGTNSVERDIIRFEANTAVFR